MKTQHKHISYLCYLQGNSHYFIDYFYCYKNCLREYNKKLIKLNNLTTSHSHCWHLTVIVLESRGSTPVFLAMNKQNCSKLLSRVLTGNTETLPNIYKLCDICPLGSCSRDYAVHVLMSISGSSNSWAGTNWSSGVTPSLELAYTLTSPA